MDIIKFGKLSKCQKGKIYAKCKSCGTKVVLQQTDIFSDDKWECPFCNHRNKIISFEDKIKNIWDTIKDIAKILATPIAFPIYIVVFIIAGVIGFARDTWENVDDIARAIGYILGVLLCIGIVCGVIGIAVASFKLGYYEVMNY